MKAAVVHKAGEPPTMEPINIAQPDVGEALVRIVSAGICHTDVAWADGELFDAFPVVLGHECAGIVEAVGPGVANVRPGDRVGIALAHHCGHCVFCETGRPMLCVNRPDDRRRLSLHGESIVQGFGVGGFAELVVVREASAIPIPDDVPIDIAALIGCATATGLGAVFNIAHVEYGSRVAIFGGGGVGLNIVMGCVLAGAERIVIVEPNETRRVLALELGATDAIPPDDVALDELAPDGFEYVFESVGRQETMELAIRITRRGGTATIVGAATPDIEFRVNALDFVPSQRRILGCQTGNVRPNVDFDRFYRLYSRGRLPLDRLVSTVLPFDKLTDAFERSRQTQGVRTMVRVSDE